MLRVWGAYICSGLYKDGLIFRILRYKYWTEINVVTQNEIQNKKNFHLADSQFLCFLTPIIRGHE